MNYNGRRIYEQPSYEHESQGLGSRIMMVLGGIVAIGALVAGVYYGARGMSSGLGRGDRFVPISGYTVDGTAINTDDYADKILVVDFWATWCPPCREGIPKLVAVQEEFADKGVQVIGVSCDQSPKDVTNYCRQAGVNFPSVFQGADEASVQYDVHSIPTTLIVGRDGKILFRGVGVGDIRAEVISALE